jgi:hypothetical protein
MNARLCVCALLVAFQPWSARAGQSTGAVELAAAVQLPAHGRFLIENATEWPAITHAELQASLERLSELRAGKPSSPYARDDAAWVPAILGIAHTVAEEFRTSHRLLVFDRGHWAQFVEWQPAKARTRHDGMRQCVFRSGREVVVTSLAQGRSLPTMRRRAGGVEDGLTGSLLDFARACRQVPVLLRLAQEQGSLRAGADGLELEVRFEGASALDAVDDVAPLGFVEIAGRAVGRFRADASSKSFLLEWRDLGDALVDRLELSWAAGASMPSTCKRESFVPGGSRALYRSVDSVLELGAGESEPAEDELDDVTWKPVPGETVLDWRFGKWVDYQVGPDGSAPSDSEVIVRAQSRAQEPSSTDAPLIRAAEPKLVEAPNEARGPIVASNATVALGPQPVGTQQRVEFELVNRGATVAHLGRIEVDCGCIDPVLSRNRLQPGESALLFAGQQVQGLGPQRHRIAVWWSDESAPAIELFIEFTGTPRLLVFPESIVLGRIVAEQALRCEVIAPIQGCLSSAEPPRCSAAGYDANAEWTRDPTSDAWRAEIELLPQEELLYGAQEVQLSFSSDACPDHHASTRLVFERVPAGARATWPECTIAISDSAASSYAWCCPAGVSIEQLERRGALDTLGVTLEGVPSADDGQRRCLLLTSDARTRSPATAVVRVHASCGVVLLQLVFVP